MKETDECGYIKIKNHLSQNDNIREKFFAKHD